MTAEKPRAARVFPTVATMAAEQGFYKPHYAVCLDNGLLYRWAPDDTTDADDFSVVEASGDVDGRWLHVPGDVRGDDLTDASVTITVAQKFIRYLPAATLSANRTITIDDASAIEGQVITIVRLDATAFTLAVVNGGVDAGTLCTLPVSQRWFADFRFDGTNWALLRAGQLPS